MPKDPRPFITLPLDFDEHPRTAALSDSAWRAFVEMNLYSRRNRLDGVIVEAVAERRWPKKALAELVTVSGGKSLVDRVDGAYSISGYADHQLTAAAADELSAKRAAAGARGGKGKANAVANGQANALANALQTGSRSQKSEVKTFDSDDLVNSSPVVDAQELTDETLSALKLQALKRAERDGFKLADTRLWFEEVLGFDIDMMQACEIAEFILGKAQGIIHNVPGYLRTVTSGDPDSVRQAAFTLDIRAFA